jgi:hypothetical protein
MTALSISAAGTRRTLGVGMAFEHRSRRNSGSACRHLGCGWGSSSER